jgi:D-alanine--poly(phosphoribitol) ligase subunit 1
MTTVRGPLQGDLLERIDHWGSVAPRRLTHISVDRRLTYGELVRRSDVLADRLAATLPDEHCPVVVLGHKEPELLIAFLGVAKSGHPYVPVENNLPPQRLQRITEVSRAPLTLTPETVALLTLDESPRISAPVAHHLPPAAPYYIMFTSGSTGEPKGVVITHACLESFLNWMLLEQAPPEGEVFLNQVPYSFDVSMMDTYLALVTGGTVFSVTREDVARPRQLHEAFARSGLTIWVSTPSFAQLCLVQRSFNADLLPRLRRFLFCGETLPPAVASQLLDRFPGAEVWNTYGPTEATVATTSIRVDRDVLARYSPLPIGYPMPGTRVLVFDDEGRAAPSGTRGEIVIAGPNVSPGYLGRPDLTARAFFELDGQRAYRTGDWGRVQDGLLFCEGRMDNQIKLHGHRIELGDIEANLRALAGVRDALVLPTLWHGQPDALSAFVVMAERGPESDFDLGNRLRAQLAERVPAYMLPRQFNFLEAFPMTPNGKADRKKLIESLALPPGLPASEPTYEPLK